MDRLSVEAYRESEKLPIIVVLDNIRSLHNVGSVFRTADAFLLTGIYLCGITGKPPHREIHKTALGSTDSVSWQYFENTIDAIHKLKADNYKILSLEQAEGSIELSKIELDAKNKYALILGNEVHGVAQAVIDASDYCLEIPQFGTKHSLNVSVSGGIAIWELCSKLRFK